jgi:hypothetical protein
MDGVWIGELDLLTHLYIPLGTAGNYSATANLHNSQITTATAKPSPACSVFNSRSLASASNSEDSLASRAHVITARRISRN